MKCLEPDANYLGLDRFSKARRADSSALGGTSVILIGIGIVIGFTVGIIGVTIAEKGPIASKIPGIGRNTKRGLPRRMGIHSRDFWRLAAFSIVTVDNTITTHRYLPIIR